MGTIPRRVYKVMPKPGSISNLKMAEDSLPPPGEEEVCIKVRAIGLNFPDVYAIFGLYKAAPKGAFIPGLEYSGEIISTGQKVTGFTQGDRVMGVIRFGAYSDYINIDSDYITKLPPEWTYEEGAAFIVQALTAYYALIVLADIRQEQTVLIHSAAGGVGLFANRIAKNFGAYTIGTVSSDRKVELLKREGYDDYIIRSDRFREDLQEKLGSRELNIVLDSIGGQIFKDGFRLLAPEGRMIVYGSANFLTPGKKPDYLKLMRQYWKRPMLDPTRMIEWNKSVMAFNLIHLYRKKGLFKNYLQELSNIDIGKPYIGEMYPFEQLRKAVRHLQAGTTMGKVVVRV